MSAAEKKHPTELIQIGSKRPRLYAVPKDKVKSLEKLIEEYLVENKNIPAHEVFNTLDEKYSKVGNILSGYRLRDGLTQTELAQKIKTSQPVIAAIENGKRKVGKTLAHKFAKVFNAKYESFLG